MNTLLRGGGLGFRRELMPDLKKTKLDNIDFFEIAPENWLHAGGRYQRDLRFFTEQKPFSCHGLSLSLGSSDQLDVDLLRNIKGFLNEHNVALYTEHLSWCSESGHLYDLLPIPCTYDAVRWVSDRIKRAQDILERTIAIENASYYFSPPGAEMREEQFINEVVNESGCLLHLDVNNIYVNSQNFNFDADAYLQALPLDKVCYLHVAGHYVEDDGLIIDTHGADVIDPVWRLLERAYDLMQVDPRLLATCLERDFNFPDIGVLQQEVDVIHRMQQRCFERKYSAGLGGL